MQHMPSTSDSLDGDGKPISRMVNEGTRASSISRKSEESNYHGENNESKHVPFRTASMRAWNVPLERMEMRATEDIN